MRLLRRPQVRRILAQARIRYNGGDFRHWNAARRSLSLPGLATGGIVMGDAEARLDAQRIDTLVRAVYACISGTAGEARDWNRFRALHRPDARSLRTVIDADGKPRAESFDVEEYIANVTPFFAQNAFFEVETAQRVERFGQVAHVWSRYEARTEPDGGTLLKRGANSIQLFHDSARWWIVSTIWDNERDGLHFDLF